MTRSKSAAVTIADLAAGEHGEHELVVVGVDEEVEPAVALVIG